MKNETNKISRRPGRPVGTRKVKMNKAQVEDLLTTSLNRILDEHLSYTEYVKWIVNEHKISNQMANEYWLKTWSLLQDKYQLERDKLINKHLQKYWTIYDTAMELGDLSNARQTLNDISKLLGMNEPEKLDVKQELKIRFNFGQDDKSES